MAEVTTTLYESALEEFRIKAMDYEDEVWDQWRHSGEVWHVGVENDPVAKVMWKMIKTLEDMR